MEKGESKIDMDALDAITDKVLSYGPPRPRKKSLTRPIPSPPDRMPKKGREKRSSKKEEKEQDDEES